MSGVSSNSRPGSQSDSLEKTTDLTGLRDLIKSVKMCMLTTMDETGNMHSRPMGINHPEEFSGSLFMFTYGESHKCFEIGKEHRVNLSFADPSHQKFASISGLAEIIRDKRLIEQKWTPSLNTWFPKGLDEPDIALIKVTANAGEYWDVTNSSMGKTYSFIKGKITGRHEEAEIHKQVQF